MATSCSNINSYFSYNASFPKIPSAPPPVFPCYPFGLNISPLQRVCAKFDSFQGQEKEEVDTSSEEQLIKQEQEEDDSCLPSDLEGAVRQSSQASATFVNSGGMRAIVELLIPQLQFLDDEGAQAELWDLSRIFLETLIDETGCQIQCRNFGR